MKKPVAPASYGHLANNSTELAAHDKYRADLEKYEAYLADKKVKNVAYRARRTEREQKAQQEAAALRANRDIDPTREEWLVRAANLLMKHLADLELVPTGPAKVALGVPPSKSRKNRTWGVCYHLAASQGGFREIFISPELTDTRKILGVLTHELLHACLKDGVGHRAPFKKACEKVGFTFEKCEHADDGAEWWAWAGRIAKEMGNIPHAALNCTMISGGKKKQKTRLLLLECPCCKIKLRTTKKTLTTILEATSRTIARCISPECEGQVDFEMMLRELEEEGEGGEEEE